MNKKSEGRLLEQVEQMHKALMGNGKLGLLSEFNMWKGGLIVITFLLSTGLAYAIFLS